MPLPKLDPVPSFVAGPQAIRCDECGWEGIWILPEETNQVIGSLFEHIQQHGIILPKFSCQVF